MNIAPISIAKSTYSRNINNHVSFSGQKKKQEINLTDLQQKQLDFIKNGGKIHFDTATVDGKPFTGQLTRKYKDEQVGGGIILMEKNTLLNSKIKIRN